MVLFTTSKVLDEMQAETMIETVRPKRISDQVRAAIERSGMSRYAISKATGVDQAVLSRFMAGDGGMRLETLDRLCATLGLQLTIAKKRRGAKR